VLKLCTTPSRLQAGNTIARGDGAAAVRTQFVGTHGLPCLLAGRQRHAGWVTRESDEPLVEGAADSDEPLGDRGVLVVAGHVRILP